MSAAEESGFLSRWSRRKVQARQGEVPAEPAAVQPSELVATRPAPAPQSVDLSASPGTPPPDSPTQPAEPPPTLDDVAALTRESDFSRFVAPGVDGDVKNAALKKLFGDPQFNVMDGLDIYIDDYSKPDPLPLASIRKMAQAAFLGLIEEEPSPAAETTPSQTATAQAPKSAEVDATATAGKTPEPDENADLRLQPHDAAGCGGAEDGAAADERRQS